jgi:hypothetical protein
MGKSDDRARLEALLAQFKGEIKRVPSSRSVVAAPRAKKKPARKRPDAGERKTQGVGEASPTEGNDKVGLRSNLVPAIMARVTRPPRHIAWTGASQAVTTLEAERRA